MGKITGDKRVFLFLQGPHGPFFHRLGAMLRKTGAEVWRVGYNAGDRAFWFNSKSYLPFRGTQDDWRDFFINLIREKSVTDLVLYGDVRRIHAEAVEEAKRHGLTVHVFEEGYMRPYWVTYERGGSNGHSRLMQMSVEDMRRALALSDIKLAHSVFALPFAILGGALAAPRSPEDGSLETGKLLVTMALIVACMVVARTWAMLVNRVADARLDARNPRTQRRVFARGDLSRRDGVILLLLCLAIFVALTALFGVLRSNWWPLILSVPVLVWIGFYSFTKRFTFLCHLFLGGALASSPVAAAIAMDPSALSTEPGLWWIALMVLCWVVGFDIVYALQDMEHDQDAGLHSVPSRFGWRGAVWIARALHAVAAAALALAWRSSAALGTLFAIASALCVALLVLEHTVLARRGRAGIPVAFFTINGVISLVLGAAGVIDALSA